jgi:hypothetical protein
VRAVGPPVRRYSGGARCQLAWGNPSTVANESQPLSPRCSGPWSRVVTPGGQACLVSRHVAGRRHPSPSPHSGPRHERLGVPDHVASRIRGGESDARAVAGGRDLEPGRCVRMGGRGHERPDGRQRGGVTEASRHNRTRIAPRPSDARVTMGSGMHTPSRETTSAPTNGSGRVGVEWLLSTPCLGVGRSCDCRPARRLDAAAVARSLTCHRLTIPQHRRRGTSVRARNENRVGGVNVDAAEVSFGQDPVTRREPSGIGGPADRATQTRPLYKTRRSPT